MQFVELLKDFIQNDLLLAPLIAWLSAQVLKFIIHSVVEREIRISRLFGDGGMPSGHSATVSSLAVLVGWSSGLDSPIFALSFIFAIVVMHDATGVRLEAGKQATVIKQLTQAFNSMFFEKDEQIRTEKLKEFVGHTPTQVAFGCVLGIVVGILFIVISGVDYRFAIEAVSAATGA